MLLVSKFLHIAALVSALAPLCGPASAQAPADPLAALEGRTIRFIIGGTPAGDADFYGRGFLDGLEAVLPQTTIHTQNISGGGGSLALVEAMASGGGPVITLALVHSTPVYSQIFGSELAPFDLGEFHWIGALTNNQNVVAVRSSLGIASVEALVALGRPLVLPVSGTAEEIEAGLLAAMTPLHLRIVPDVDDEIRDTLLLAGDADLALASYLSLKQRVDSGDLIIVLRIGSSGYPPELAGVSTLAETARPSISPQAVALTDSLDGLGRLVVAAPATDPADVEALRAAFDLAVAKPEVAAAYQRQSFVLAPTPGAEVERQMDLLLGNVAAGDLFAAYLACGRQETSGPEQECVP
jgi:tripartite-type tricarboxylate transporter receptor subunit TctC